MGPLRPAPKIFRFKAAFKPGISDPQKTRILREIQSRTEAILSQMDMDNVSFEIEESEDLQADVKTGKFRWVVRGESTPL